LRRFNVTGLCTPEEDYMVDISSKIKQIKRLVDRRSIRKRMNSFAVTLKEGAPKPAICLPLIFVKIIRPEELNGLRLTGSAYLT